MSGTQKVNSIKKSKVFTLVVILWTLNALARIFFAYLIMTQGNLLDTPVSNIVTQFILVVFIILGVTGILTVQSLWNMESWGINGVYILSVSTIVFDAWGVFLQYTAALGFLVPMISLLYLILADRNAQGT